MTKAINLAKMREKNEKMILSLINRGPVSRASIAKQSGLTKAAVTIIVDELLKRGIVTEKPAKHAGTVGRNPVMLYINKEDVHIIGVNISRSSVTVGLCNLGGDVLAEKSFPTKEPGEAFAKIKLVIDDILQKNNLKIRQIYKIGVTTPGPVNLEAGRVLNPPNFEGWHNVDVKKELSGLTGCEVCLRNVSDGAALSEKYFGVARELVSFVTLHIDDGIGSAIVQDNHLFPGLCEVGHITIDYDGPVCRCGNRGCLEGYASIPAILKDTPYVTWSEAAEDTELVKREAEFIASALVTVNNIFGLEAAVISGVVTEAGDELIRHTRDIFRSRTISGGNVEIVPGCIKSRTLFAAAVAAEKFFG